MYSFPDLEPVCCSMSSSNCCFLTCIPNHLTCLLRYLYAGLYAHNYLCCCYVIMKIFTIYSHSSFQVCNLVLLSLVTMLSIATPKLIHSSNIWKLEPFNQHFPIFPTSKTLTATNSLSVSMCLAFLDSTHS